MKYNKEGLTLANSKEFQKLEEYDRALEQLEEIFQELANEKSNLFYAMNKEEEEIGSPVLEKVKKLLGNA